jgi:hypothetical protein
MVWLLLYLLRHKFVAIAAHHWGIQLQAKSASHHNSIAEG